MAPETGIASADASGTYIEYPIRVDKRQGGKERHTIGSKLLRNPQLVMDPLCLQLVGLRR